MGIGDWKEEGESGGVGKGEMRKKITNAPCPIF
jgi:hypothetical protein